MCTSCTKINKKCKSAFENCFWIATTNGKNLSRPQFRNFQCTSHTLHRKSICKTVCTDFHWTELYWYSLGCTQCIYRTVCIHILWTVLYWSSLSLAALILTELHNTDLLWQCCNELYWAVLDWFLLSCSILIFSGIWCTDLHWALLYWPCCTGPYWAVL